MREVKWWEGENALDKQTSKTGYTFLLNQPIKTSAGEEGEEGRKGRKGRKGKEEKEGEIW